MWFYTVSVSDDKLWDYSCRAVPVNIGIWPTIWAAHISVSRRISWTWGAVMVVWRIFKRLRKIQRAQRATVSFVMSVCLPACLPVRMKQLGCRWTDFHEIWYLSIFRKSVEKIQVSLKSDKSNRCFTWRPLYISDKILFIFLRMRNASDKSCRKKCRVVVPCVLV